MSATERMRERDAMRMRLQEQRAQERAARLEARRNAANQHYVNRQNQRAAEFDQRRGAPQYVVDAQMAGMSTADLQQRRHQQGVERTLADSPVNVARVEGETELGVAAEQRRAAETGARYNYMGIADTNTTQAGVARGDQQTQVELGRIQSGDRRYVADAELESNRRLAAAQEYAAEVSSAPGLITSRAQADALMHQINTPGASLTEQIEAVQEIIGGDLNEDEVVELIRALQGAPASE